MVFWSTDYLATVIGLGAAAAPAVASLFLVGMALGRLLGGQIGARLVRPRPVLLVALGLSAAGFALFWSSGHPALAGVGLVVMGR